MAPDQRIGSTFLRILVKEVGILLFVSNAVLRISAPYSNTALTLIAVEHLMLIVT